LPLIDFVAMTNDLRAELTRDSGEERQHKRVKRVKTSFDEEKGRLHGFQLGSWRKTIEKDSIQGLVKEAEALFTAKDTLPQTQTPWIGYGDVPTCALEVRTGGLQLSSSREDEQGCRS